MEGAQRREEISTLVRKGAGMVADDKYKMLTLGRDSGIAIGEAPDIYTRGGQSYGNLSLYCV